MSEHEQEPKPLTDEEMEFYRSRRPIPMASNQEARAWQNVFLRALATLAARDRRIERLEAASVTWEKACRQSNSDFLGLMSVSTDAEIEITRLRKVLTGHCPKCGDHLRFKGGQLECSDCMFDLDTWLREADGAPSKYPEGMKRIKAERQRQIEKEGWDSGHDDEHEDGVLEAAALCYQLAGVYPESDDWPWAPESWKPKGLLRDMERAGALYLAAADRHARKAIECREEADVCASHVECALREAEEKEVQ